MLASIACLDVLARANEDLGVVAIDDDEIAGLDLGQDILGAAHDGDVEGPRDDRDMGGGRPLFEHQRLQSAAVVIEEFGRPHRARNEDEFLGQLGGGRGRHLAGEMLLQAVGPDPRDRAGARADRDR